LNRKFLLAALFVVVPLGAVHAMTVATFLQKAEALEARGMMALLSSDMGLLKGEVRGSAATLKAENDAARRAGRRPAFCAPERVRMSSDELLTFFRQMPPALRQRTEVRDALRAYMVRRYPCR
jgi:hypothetical protein